MKQELPGAYAEWRRLARTMGLRGKRVFDTRIVALMGQHRINHVLTFDVTHFQQFVPHTGIVVLDPASY